MTRFGHIGDFSGEDAEMMREELAERERQRWDGLEEEEEETYEP